MQAIMLAFDAVREILKAKFPEATWQGLPIDLAFPKSLPYVVSLDVYKEIEAFADQLLRARFGAD